MDYENINEIIAPFNLHVYDENPQNVRGSFITQMENIDRKCLTPEKRRDLRKWLCLGILGFGIFGGKNA